MFNEQCMGRCTSRCSTVVFNTVLFENNHFPIWPGDRGQFTLSVCIYVSALDIAPIPGERVISQRLSQYLINRAIGQDEVEPGKIKILERSMIATGLPG